MTALQRIVEKLEVWINRLWGKPDPMAGNSRNPSGAYESASNTNSSDPDEQPITEPPLPGTTIAPSGAIDGSGERKQGTSNPRPMDAVPPSSATTTTPAGATDEPGGRTPGTPDARASDTPRRPGEDDVSKGGTEFSDTSRSGKPASPKPPSETGGKRSDGSGGRASHTNQSSFSSILTVIGGDGDDGPLTTHH